MAWIYSIYIVTSTLSLFMSFLWSSLIFRMVAPCWHTSFYISLWFSCGISLIVAFCSLIILASISMKLISADKIYLLRVFLMLYSIPRPEQTMVASATLFLSSMTSGWASRSTWRTPYIVPLMKAWWSVRFSLLSFAAVEFGWASTILLRIEVEDPKNTVTFREITPHWTELSEGFLCVIHVLASTALLRKDCFCWGNLV